MQQVAALPFAPRDTGFEVMLVTSRKKRARSNEADTEGGGRWILPKGWPKRRETLAEAAMREAHEEAGVVGAVHPAPLGDYVYKKNMRAGYKVPSRVFVFALRVYETRDKWPEKGQRDRRWVTLAEAAALVDDRDLVRLLRGLTDNDGAALHSVLAGLDAGRDGAPLPAPAAS